MASVQGKLIMFDGPDGVGKSTQFELVRDTLLAQGRKVYATHLLGGTEIGEAIRAVLFSQAPRPPLTNLHANLAVYYALAAHLAEKRQQGYVILVDRSPLSLIAYQVYGDGLEEQLGYAACDQALSAFAPDAVLLLTAPIDVLLERRRLQQEYKPTDYFDHQKLDYHHRTTRGYEEAAKRYRVVRIDGVGDIASVQAAVVAALNPLLS